MVLIITKSSGFAVQFFYYKPAGEDRLRSAHSSAPVCWPDKRQQRPGFPNSQPESLYRRDSPWISSYHIQNSFQLDITDIYHWKLLHGFIYYITQRVVVRKSEYKPLGLKGSKQEMVAVASLRAFLHLELHLHRQNLSVARASKFQLYHPSSLVSNSWISSWIFLETFFFETWHMCVC